MLDRIQMPEPVTMADRADALALFEDFHTALSALSHYIAPTMGTRYALEEGETVDDYDGPENAPLELVCPWCERTVDADSLYDFEVGIRHTYPDYIDGTAEHVPFHYDGGGDFDSIQYVHELCGLPVAAPDGWEVGA